MNITNSEETTKSLQEIKQNVTAFLYMIEDLEDGMVTPEDILDVLKIVNTSIGNYIFKVENGELQEEQQTD
tara:strand:- start:534 stop:746 length:213 start_codon:yes stop_codon:yes gene_type:complete